MRVGVGWMGNVLFVCTTAEFDTIVKEARAGEAEKEAKAREEEERELVRGEDLLVKRIMSGRVNPFPPLYVRGHTSHRKRSRREKPAVNTLADLMSDVHGFE
jgi:hypothetical protein